MTANDMTFMKLVSSKLPTSIFTTEEDAELEDMLTQIQDACIELEPCFKIRGITTPTGLWERVGVEDNYNPNQKAIVAALAAFKYLQKVAIAFSNDVHSNPTVARFLTKAAAGSAEAGFEQKKKELLNMATTINDLLTYLGNEVKRRMSTMGCTYSGLGLGIPEPLPEYTAPFIVVKDNQ